MSLEIDVTNLLHEIHSKVFFSKKVQKGGLRPTSLVEHIQYEAVLSYKNFVHSCAALQFFIFHEFFQTSKNKNYFWLSVLWPCIKDRDILLVKYFTLLPEIGLFEFILYTITGSFYF